jgi:hypothetical protein
MRLRCDQHSVAHPLDLLVRAKFWNGALYKRGSPTAFSEFRLYQYPSLLNTLLGLVLNSIRTAASVMQGQLISSSNGPEDSIISGVLEEWRGSHISVQEESLHSRVRLQLVKRTALECHSCRPKVLHIVQRLVHEGWWRVCVKDMQA